MNNKQTKELLSLLETTTKDYLIANGYTWKASTEWSGGLPAKAGGKDRFEFKISLNATKTKKVKK